MRAGRRAFVASLGFLLAAGCARPPVEEWEPSPTEPVPLTELASGLRLRAEPAGTFWRLAGLSGEVRIYPGLTLAWMDGGYVQLERPVETAAGVPLVPLELAERIRAKAVSDGLGAVWDPAVRGLTVVLDAGHGGKDMGGTGTRGTLEKDVTLAVTRAAADLLREAGCRVVLTRECDEDVALRDRADLSNRSNADLFVSIHANCKHPDAPAMRGVEVYYPTNSFRLEAAASLWPKPSPSGILRSTRESLALAHEVHRSILAETQAATNGVRQHPKPLAVLRYTTCPAILVEMGYLTDPAEEHRLADPAYQRRLAQGIASGVLAHHRRTRGRVYAAR